MATATCSECGNPMSKTSVVCPHCGARRAGATPGVAGKLNQDEMRALIVADAASRGPQHAEGLFATLVLPHPATRGGARAAELALTVLCLPLVLAGSVLFMFSHRRERRQMETTRGELAPVALMTVLGAPLILGGLGLTTTGFVITGVELAALVARAVIRLNAATAASRELSRLAAPEKPAVPPKPVAPAKTAAEPVAPPIARPAAPSPAAPPIARPAPAEPPIARPAAPSLAELPGSEPRLLK